MNVLSSLRPHLVVCFTLLFGLFGIGSCLANQAKADHENGDIYRVIKSLSHAQQFLQSFDLYSDANIENLNLLGTQALSFLLEENPNQAISLLKKLSHYNLVDGNVQQSIDNSYQILDIAKQVDDQNALAQAWHNIGNGHYYLGEFPEAIGVYQKALEIRKRIGDKIKVADTLNNMGYVHGELGRHEEAVEEMLRAYQYYQEEGSSADLPSVIVNIAGIYLTQEKYPQAIKYYLDSLALYDQGDNSSEKVAAYINLGIAYRHSEKVEQAIKAQKVAIELSLSHNLLEYYVPATNNLAALYNSQGQYKKALETLKTGLEKGIQRHDKASIARLYYNMANTYVGLEQVDLAREYAEKSYQLLLETGEKQAMDSTLLLFSEIEEQRGNFAYALELYKKYKGILDEKEETKKNQNLQQQQARFEFLKHQDELALVQKEKEIEILALEQQTNQLQDYLLFSFCLIVCVFLYFKTRQASTQIQAQKQSQNLIKNSLENKRQLTEQSISYMKRVLDELAQSNTNVQNAHSENADKPSNAKRMAHYRAQYRTQLELISYLNKFESSAYNPVKLELNSYFTKNKAKFAACIATNRLEIIEESSRAVMVELDSQMLDKVACGLLSLVCTDVESSKVSLAVLAVEKNVKISFHCLDCDLSEQSIAQVLDDEYDVGNLKEEVFHFAFTIKVIKRLVEVMRGRLIVSAHPAQGLMVSTIFHVDNANSE